MRYRSFFLGIGSALAAATVLTLVVPKAAHAVVAALVQVTNTTSNPVPNLDTERNARIPYQSTQQPSGNCPNGAGVQSCTFNFTKPSTGYRLVVENVSGMIALAPGTTQPPFAMLYEQDGIGTSYWGFTGTQGQASNGLLQMYAFNQQTRAVFDAGDVGPAISLTANFGPNVGQYMTLSGYLENCALTGCPYTSH